MLFKWIVLIVIAWYVFRAAGNLIAVARGEQPPIDGQRGPSQRPPEDGPSVRVSRKPGRTSTHPPAHRSEDVEDARFTDL